MCISTKERYINPFTDFGFKKLFGEEANKDLLIDFLNELLREEEGDITNLTYLKTEQLGGGQFDRKAIFDIYCENAKGEKFIVELQKAKQQFFKDRALFYSTFPIREQAQTGKWNFELKKVYTIAILDFIFDEDKKDTDKFLYRVQLSDIETNQVFYDKLTFVYLEMPKFTKSLEELETHFEKWLFVLRNLQNLKRLPEKLQEQVFKKVFQQAEVANLTPKEVDDYEESLKVYRDLHNVIDTARIEGEQKGLKKGIEQGIEQGLEQGIEQGRKGEKIAIAINLLDVLDDQTISLKTGLSVKEVFSLRTKRGEAVD